ncbi:putative reverse transcriptase domain-containing protein [Tanacetum coccineum]
MQGRARTSYDEVWGGGVVAVYKKGKGSDKTKLGDQGGDEGLTGYYQRFIQDFSKIASSLTKLTRKNTPFEWGREQEEAFTTLRKKLCEAPILLIPEGTEDMVVYSDASYSGLGCVLIQRGKRIRRVDALHPTFHFEEDSRGIKSRQGRIYIPFQSDVKKLLLDEAHKISRRARDKDAYEHDLSSLNGRSKRIQMLKDMLRACAIDFGGNWDDHPPLVEFAYNNSYHSSIKIPPYEMLYGRKCQTPVCVEEVWSRELASTDVVLATMEKIKTI